MKQQGLGGDIVNIVSKNALVSGPKNVAYGTAKAAQLHMSRLMAAELGNSKIRVNVVNPDAVIEGSYIWQGGWAEGRAKTYGIKVEDLPKNIKLSASDPSFRMDDIPLDSKLSEALSMVEKRMILRAMEMTNHVQAHAAEILGIAKSGLSQKIKKYNLEVGSKK